MSVCCLCDGRCVGALSLSLSCACRGARPYFTPGTHKKPNNKQTTHTTTNHLQTSAPLDPAALIKPEQLEDYDPNQVLVITTGSQAEPRAQLCLAAQGASHNLKLQSSDMLLYSAKVCLTLFVVSFMRF